MKVAESLRVAACDVLDEDLPGVHVQGCDDGLGAVPAVFELAPLGLTGTGGPARMAAGASLHRGFLVHAE